MSARVTSEEVRQLFPELDEDASLTLFISVATNLVDDVLADVTPELGVNRLHDIELFLAAHYAAISYLRVSQEGVSTATESVQYALGLNFNVTMFGQQALVLDTSGELAKLQKRTKNKGYSGPGTINWLGMTLAEHDSVFGEESEFE